MITSAAYLEKEILKEHSKKQTLKIVKYIGNDQERFNELLKLFLEGSNTVTQRASWVVSYCAEQKPQMIRTHLKKIITNLKNPVHAAVKRNTLRLLQHTELPKSLLGETTNICFNLLSSTNEPVAVKVFSMTILYNITQREPDLQNELKIIIEDQLPFASPAFRSRGNKTLALLNKKNF